MPAGLCSSPAVYLVCRLWQLLERVIKVNGNVRVFLALYLRILPPGAIRQLIVRQDDQIIENGYHGFPS